MPQESGCSMDEGTKIQEEIAAWPEVMQVIASVSLQPELLTKPPARQGSFQHLNQLTEPSYFLFSRHLKLAQSWPSNF